LEQEKSISGIVVDDGISLSEEENKNRSDNASVPTIVAPSFKKAISTPQKKNTGWIILYIVVILFFVVNITNQPYGTPVDGVLDASTDPQQLTYDEKDPITLNAHGSQYKIFRLAQYKITARILSKKHYTFDDLSDIVPYDFALGWGVLASNHYDNQVKFNQYSRWYHFIRSQNCSLSEEYIYQHSANTHIIPANQNIKKTIAKTKHHAIIELEGYLVRIESHQNVGTRTFESSLSRLDTGAGACEVMYVNKVTMGRKEYK
jgi:hypothetical protein